MRQLDRKLLRDLLGMKGQAAAICLVIACGIATFVMSLSTLRSLELSQEAYYRRYRFANIFAHLKRAPRSLTERIARIPGVSRVQTRIVVDVTIDVEGLAEPAVGRLISIPQWRLPGLNALHIRAGRNIDSTRNSEIVASESFAIAHGIEPGDTIRAVINGRRQQLTIVGIALSPEYILQIQGGQSLPDEKLFGVFWMSYPELAAAFNMDGAFNDVCLSTMRGASEPEILARLDRITEPYGGVGAYGRDEQLSHRFLSDEIKGLRGMALVAPIIFLGVAAFLLNVVLARLVSTQREQIAALKAFGYTNREVGLHYVKLVITLSVVGVVLGTAAGVWLGHGITEMYARFYRFPVFYFRFDWTVILLGLLITVAAMIIGTLAAVLRAVRLPPAEAMRPEPPATYRATVVERLGIGAFFSQTSRMILRHLERRPIKALFSSFGIALAVGVLILGNFTEDAINYLIDFQFHQVQRQNMSISFVEPMSASAVHEIERLPAVLRTETFRSIPVRLRFRHRSHRLGIMGLPSHGSLFRLMQDDLKTVQLPEEGLVLSEKLAQLLQIGVGDMVTVEIMEGERATRDIQVASLLADYSGTNAYMDIRALHRLMREGGSISGAFLWVDSAGIEKLYRALKMTPMIASVSVKDAVLESFEETVAENLLRMKAFHVLFACIIAIGVVYNTARISLSERGRELATLRVMGFTRGEISAILLGELTVLTLVGIPLGFCIGYGFALLTTWAFETELYRIPLVVSQSTFALAATVTLMAAAFSGLVVRRRLDRLDLVSVLKSEE